MPSHVIRDAHDKCRAYGCQITDAINLVTKEVQKKMGSQFTQALWCDFGRHCFSSRDTGKKLLSVQGEVDGEIVTESWTACSQHVPQSPTQTVAGEIST